MNSNMINEPQTNIRSCLEFSYDSLSEDEYCTHTWPAIENVLRTFLHCKSGQYVPIHYEEIYCQIYKCVCKDYRERLYNDLIQFIQAHIVDLEQHMRLIFENAKQNQSTSIEYFIEFNNCLQQYEDACKGIVAIFHYLNINYVRQKLKSDLTDILFNLIKAHLIDKHVNSILTIVNDLDFDGTNSISCETLNYFFNKLYAYDTDYAKINQNIFIKYSTKFKENLNKILNDQHHQLQETLSQLRQQPIQPQQQEMESNQRKRHADDGLAQTDEPQSKLFC